MNQIDLDRLSRTLTERLGEVRRSGRGRESAALLAITQSLVDLGVADDVGITEVDPAGRFRTVAPTSRLVLDADTAQYELSEGPCVEASYDFAATLSSTDVAHDLRWPKWGPAAATLGVVSVISLRLYAADTAAMGAINMYSRRRRDYTADDIDVARIAASRASVELAHHRSEANLWEAIDGRHRIGLAQGMLMERFGLDEEASFALLRRFSQSHHVRLAIVADTLVRTRELNDRIPGPPGDAEAM